MNEAEFSPEVAKEHIEATLADPALASLRLAGAPVLVISGAPGRVVYASAAAQSLFAGDLPALARRLLLGAEPGARRIVALSRSLLPGAAPRLERLRFFFGPVADTVTVLCRRVTVAPGQTLFALAVLGVRAPQATARRSDDAPPPRLTVAAGVDDVDAPIATRDAAAQSATVPALAPESLHVADARSTGEIDEAAELGEAAGEQAEEQPQPAVAPARGARFAWRTDSDHVVTFVAPALAEAVGAANAEILGQSLVDIAREKGLDVDGRLVAALAARDTFTGVETLWPAGEGLRAPIALGAAPAFGVDDRFDGFRGYGVVRSERIAAPAAEQQANDAAARAIDAAMAPVEQASSPLAVESEAARQEILHVETPVEDSAATTSPIHALALGPHAGAVEAQSQSTEDDEDAQIVNFVDPDDWSAEANVGSAIADAAPQLAVETESGTTAHDAPPAGDQAHAVAEADEPVSDDVTDDETDEADEIVAVSDAGEPMHRDDIGAEPAAPPLHEGAPLYEDEAAFDEAPSASAAPQSSAPGNIVPLRPQQPARRADVPHRSPAPELSPGEISAFEEIGRALGAEPAAPEAEPPLSPAASRRARDLIDLVARFGQSEEPVDKAKAAAPLAAVTDEASAKIASALPERNAAAVLERLPVGVVVSRFNVPIYANRTLLDLLDYADIDAFHAAGGLDRLFHGRAPDSGVAQIETRDGEVLPVDARVQAVDWDGQPATLVTLRRAPDSLAQEARLQETRLQEDRARESAEAARAKSLELDLRQRDAEARELHAILDTATDGVAVLDADGRILSLNRSGEALFGFDQNEVAGEPFSILVAKESQEAAAAYFEGVKSGGVQSVLNDGREFMARARQGGAIPVFVTLGRLGSGATPKFCVVLRDLTAWKKAERELGDARREAERASALKSDFLAKVSHEIRTPLNAILGFAEVIMDERFGPVGNARYRDYMRDIHKSGEHVLSLVNDLLDLSKIEAGKVDLSFTSVDINAVVAECVSIMQPQANRDRVVMRLSLAPSLPNIVADERSMRQIVLNLLSNAVKFNEPGGQVIVSTALTDAGHAVVRIKDTGVGMSDDELQTALEPFRQVSTARKNEGTGLGLPLTKALVEANRASFTIRSRKGEGTMVEVIFPPTRVLAE